MKRFAIFRPSLVLFIALAFASCPAWSRPLFSLSSASQPHVFEDAGQVAWEAQADRFGAASLRIAPTAGDGERTAHLFDAPRPLLGPDQFRAEAWVEGNPDEFSMTIVVFDARSGLETARYPLRFSAASTSARPGWHFGACDFMLEKAETAATYNVELRVTAHAIVMDGLKLCGADSILNNGDFRYVEEGLLKNPSPNQAQAPRGWRRYYAGATHDGQAEGRLAVEKDTNGAARLVVRKGAGSFVICAEPVAAPLATVGLVARAYTSDATTSAQSLTLRQYGNRGLIREDQSEAAQAFESESSISTQRIDMDPAAERLMLLVRFPVEAGDFSLRSVELASLQPLDAPPQIFLDQSGYDTGSTLRFIVATPRYPVTAGGVFAFDSSDGRRYEGGLTPLGRAIGQDQSDWGSYYFEGKSDTPQGAFTLTVTLGEHKVEAGPIAIESKRHLHQTGELAYRFYSIQRCGCVVPGWHGLCHMDDGKLPDGSHADVTGGYHNAGDMHKHMGDNTPVSVYAMTAAYELNTAFFDAIDEDHNGRADILDEAAWGAAWMLKMVDPKTGHLWTNVTNDIDYHGIPELDTDGIPGNGDDRVINTNDSSDLGAFAIASWAVLARHLPEAGYRDAAEKLWGVYEERILGGYDPRHIICALELNRTTQDPKYITAAERLVQNVLALQNSEGWFASRPQGGPEYRIVDEGTIPACLASFALAQPTSGLAGAVKDALRKYFTRSLALADNPFGIIRGYTGAEPFYFKSRDDWFGGSNSMYCSVAWGARLAARVFQDETEFSTRLRDHAANQIHWVLGMNPLNLCMLEGIGTSNRIRYHHLYAEIRGHERGAVPGEIPNGIIREPGNADRPWFDLRPPGGSPPSAESCEPWLPHNAYYLLALTAG